MSILHFIIRPWFSSSSWKAGFIRSSDINLIKVAYLALLISHLKSQSSYDLLFLIYTCSYNNVFRLKLCFA